MKFNLFEAVVEACAAPMPAAVTAIAAEAAIILLLFVMIWVLGYRPAYYYASFPEFISRLLMFALFPRR